MKKKADCRFTIILILMVILTLSFFLVYNYYLENRHLKNSLPYFLVGESIEYFNLVDMEAGEIDQQALNKKRVSIIFIMERPCSPCDKNIAFYKKIAQVLENQVTFYGIVLGRVDEAANFIHQSKANFKVYIPKQLDKFLEKMRLKLNLAQLIVYTDKVEHIHLGKLSSRDVVQILDMVKRLSKNENEN